MFGYAHVRKVDRELRDHYRDLFDDLVEGLTAPGYDRAVEVAQLPDMTRGYETVMLANADHYVLELREPWHHASRFRRVVTASSRE